MYGIRASLKIYVNVPIYEILHKLKIKQMIKGRFLDLMDTFDEPKVGLKGVAIVVNGDLSFSPTGFAARNHGGSSPLPEACKVCLQLWRPLVIA